MTNNIACTALVCLCAMSSSVLASNDVLTEQGARSTAATSQGPSRGYSAVLAAPIWVPHILRAKAAASAVVAATAAEEDRSLADLTGAWRLYMITPHNNPTPPMPMLAFNLTQQGSAGGMVGNWTAEPALLGEQRAGATGTLLSATMERDGLLRITIGRTPELPGEMSVSVRPYESGFAGSVSAGRRIVRALLWRSNQPLPQLMPLKEALHGPAR